MKLLKRYEERLNELLTQKIVIEKEIQWIKELVENLRKEAYKTDRTTEVRVDAETDEFANIETTEAALSVINDAFPKSMHQKEIAREMFRRGWQCDSKTPDQTVATTLWRLMKRKQHNIEKVGRGKFRLLKKLSMESHSSKREETKDNDEIPF